MSIESADSQVVQAFLQRAGRRMRAIALAEGAAIGLVAALIVAVLIATVRGAAGLPIVAAIALAVSGASAGAVITAQRMRRGRSIAAHVEARIPASRNVLLTAAELLDGRVTATPYVHDAVLHAAAQIASRAEPHGLFPLKRAATAITGSSAAWLLLLLVALFSGGSPGALPALPVRGSDEAAITGIEVDIVPPGYTAGPSQRVQNPDRIDALAGSVLRVTVRAAAQRVVVETVSGAYDMTSAGERTFTTSIRADADGFISFEPRNASGNAGTRQLIGLSVRPDQTPRVTITAPARDLFLPHGEQSIDVAVTSTDDHGLTSLRLTFTRISGFGEQFTFTESEIPLTVERTNARAWSARARWQLQPLALQPGDMLVYRAIATDARPGAAPTESDTYLVEIVAANAVASGGLSTDEELDRYALSQQMVILLTERLLAQRASLPAEEFAVQAQTLAAAQRRVRAEFVFMIGGELEDAALGEDHAELHEETHAQVDAEMAEGRLANQGRIELARAINAMSLAAANLARVDMQPALDAERQALTHIQRAFARTRYILRALTERERVDLARRLTGVLGDAVRDRRPQAMPTVDPRVNALRAALVETASLAAAPVTRENAARAATLAQTVLRADAASDSVRAAAQSIASAANAMSQSDEAGARTALDRAVTTLTTIVRSALPRAPKATRPTGASVLDGTLADILRSGSR
jgi:hypothetical protein